MCFTMNVYTYYVCVCMFANILNRSKVTCSSTYLHRYTYIILFLFLMTYISKLQLTYVYVYVYSFFSMPIYPFAGTSTSLFVYVFRHLHTHMNIRFPLRSIHIFRFGILYLLCLEGSLHASLVNLKVLAGQKLLYYFIGLRREGAKVQLEIGLAVGESFRCCSSYGTQQMSDCAGHIGLKTGKSGKKRKR